MPNSEDGAEEDEVIDAKSKPYTKSTERMKKILKDTMISPCDKLLKIREMMGLIREEIDEFWEYEQNKPASLEMERSELLTILVYILVQS